jgi:hypothetical protein
LIVGQELPEVAGAVADKSAADDNPFQWMAAPPPSLNRGNRDAENGGDVAFSQ